MQPEESSAGDRDASLASAAAWWATRGTTLRAERQHWQGHPIVKVVMAERRGAPTNAEWLARRLPPGLVHALSLGAGAGFFELDLVTLGAVTTFHLVDITPQLMEGATARAKEKGIADRIRCTTADINRIEIEPGAYDLITFIGSLHHVERLEHVLEACRRGLRPGGVLYVAEYVGPNRFAFPPAHVQLASEIAVPSIAAADQCCASQSARRGGGDPPKRFDRKRFSRSLLCSFPPCRRSPPTSASQ